MSDHLFVISEPEGKKAGILEVVSSASSLAGAGFAVAGGALASPVLLAAAFVTGSVALATKVASRHSAHEKEPPIVSGPTPTPL
jgi:hypothetical protein